MKTKQLRALRAWSVAVRFALLFIEFPELLEPDDKNDKPPFHVALNGNTGYNEDE